MTASCFSPTSNGALFASYRWSRLTGNFEGFFRNDNGQSDPAITSLFDFPTNDPTYSSAEARSLGFRGDIRYLGRAGNGPLPNDRTHQFKLYGNRGFGPLTLGIGVVAGSGRPLTPFAANPFYDSDGEIPEAPRGSGLETEDGFRKRTPREVTFDAHADYTLRLGGDRRIVLMADGFNLTNRQSALNYDQNTETGFGRPDPDFGRIIQYANPMRIRVGARFEW